MITAKELREQIAKIPDDVYIILQTDDEGNGYRYVNGIDYVAEGADRNFFGDDECFRASDLEDLGRTEDDPDLELVAVVY